MESFLYWCLALTTIAGAVTTIVNVVKIAKSPKDALEKRIKKIEETLKEHDEFLNKDNKRISEIEQGNRVTQKALLALLSNAIDGNNKAGLVEARDNLQKYLIER